MITAEEKERYSRQLLIPEWGEEAQEKLKVAKVLIIGAGGLGSPASLYLTAGGVGTIGIVDGDTVDRSNLQRQIIHGTGNLGQPKVESAAETLRDLNPNVEIIPIHRMVTRENIGELIEDYDFILDATDNYHTKFLINDGCVEKGKPYSHAGILGLNGQLMTYVPGKGPCYRCIFGEEPKPGEAPTAKEGGVIGPIAGIVGSFQAAEAMKYITGVGRLLTGKMLTFDLLTGRIREVPLPDANPECTACGSRRKG